MSPLANRATVSMLTLDEVADRLACHELLLLREGWIDDAVKAKIAGTEAPPYPSGEYLRPEDELLQDDTWNLDELIQRGYKSGSAALAELAERCEVLAAMVRELDEETSPPPVFMLPGNLELNAHALY